ncbi:amidohydrolase [Tistrella mobilis]
MSEPIKVFRARKILTMARNRPVATHVAIREGRILAVGDAEDAAGWGAPIDDRFADKVLMPGLVEAHCHAMEGAVWADTFLGFFPRHSPEGSLEGGIRSIEDAVQRLQRAEAALTDPDQPLLAWGFDPIYYGGARMTRHDLDRVSTTRPVLVMHASFHIMNVNTVVLDRGGLFQVTGVEGILRDGQGDVTGELQEMAAMQYARQAVGAKFALTETSIASLRRFGRSATNAGVTTCTDLYAPLDDAALDAYVAATAAEDFPVRIAPAMAAAAWAPEAGIARMAVLKDRANDKFHPGLVKVMTDGSIQGFTARLKWPGYHNGAPNGIWNQPPAVLKAQMKAYNAAGIQMHIHVNGDQASEFAIDCLAEALAEAPFPDHRHVLQHCQMADAAQFRRMAALGIAANLFANHIYYWGDQHAALTMGPDRARRMDACGTAMAEGVRFAMHSDAPITPLAPLFTAWCAVNRQTATGRELGPEEKISVADALHAITLGAAWQLRLDHLTGSIEVGKYADFAVLEDDPTEIAPQALKDVRVWGTILGGTPHQSAIGAA